jgi:hypothetical protein
MMLILFNCDQLHTIVFPHYTLYVAMLQAFPICGNLVAPPARTRRSWAGAGLLLPLSGQAPPFLARQVAPHLRLSPTSTRQYKRVAPPIAAPFFPPFLFPPIRTRLEPPPLLPFLSSTAGCRSAAATNFPLHGGLTL